MGHPFAGTFMPGSGRSEVQGLSPMLCPVEWFGHSNFGGFGGVFGSKNLKAISAIGTGGATLPMYDDKAKKWTYSDCKGRKLDRKKFEEWKTKFYKFPSPGERD